MKTPNCKYDRDTKYSTCRKQISAKLGTAGILIFCTNLDYGIKYSEMGNHGEYWILA